MKKVTCLFVLMAGICLSAFCQEIYVEEGYNGLPWGSSVEEVKDVYPKIEMSLEGECETNETFYKFTEGDIQKCFRFYDDKLYWVRVIYDDLNQKKVATMKEKIKNIYGGKWVSGEEYLNCNEPGLISCQVLIDPQNKGRETFIYIKSYNSARGKYTMTTYSSLFIGDELLEDSMEDFEL